MIKNIQIKNAQGEVTGTYPVGQIDPTFATGLTNHIEFTTKTNGENISLIGNNNINIEPRVAVGTGEGKAAADAENRKGGNISLKPGDDIELCSHHRGTGKNTEVAVKVMDGEENPVKLQVFAGDITLTTKGKDSTKVKNDAGEDIKTDYITTNGYSGGKGLPVVFSNGKFYLANGNTKKATATDTEVASEYVASSFLYNDPSVMNINVTDGTSKGYLKVRAQAIDLRCEDHGGIALQPKGADSDGHMNKIKFEHGGGDGLEFGTFNAEKTSIYTDEYRFKKDGVWKMATRTTVDSDKADTSDATTYFKYKKADDDFYDNISDMDVVATTEDIIKTAYLFNNAGVQVDRTSLNIPSDGYHMQVLSGENAVSYSVVPSGFFSESSYSDYIVRGVNSTAYNSVVSQNITMLNLIRGLGKGNTLSNVPSSWLDKDLVVIAISTSTTQVTAENSKVLVLTALPQRSCTITDIITLVDYFKTGAGKANGPWAEA